MRIQALVLAVTLSACSFFFARVPDHRGEDGHLDCPHASVLTDAVIAVTGLAVPVALLAANRNNLHSDGAIGLVIIGGPSLIVGLIYGVSALYGRDRQNTCHRLDADTSYGWIPEAQRRADEGARAVLIERTSSAWKLAKQGETSAANGDCSTANRLGEEIRALDEATFSGEYMHDAHVSACHTAAANAGAEQPAP